MTISLETQSAKIVLKPKAPLRPDALREAVRKADFTPGDIHLTVSGQVAANPDTTTRQFAELVFKLPDTGQTFLLVSPDLQKSGEKTKNRLPKLHEQVQSGKNSFTITGRVHEHKEWPIGLTVEEFAVIEEKAK